MLTESPPGVSDAPCISNWNITSTAEGLLRLHGKVDGHPELPDDWITTSPVWQINVETGCARTSSRWYRTGPCYYDNTPPDLKLEFFGVNGVFIHPDDAQRYLSNIQTAVEHALASRSA